MSRVTLLGRKRDFKDAVFFTIMMAIPTIQFLIFYIGVNFNTVKMAFQEYDPIAGKFFFSLGNFETFFQELSSMPYMKKMIVNSVVQGFFSMAVSIVLCLIFSLYIYRKQFGHKFFKVMLFVPSIVSAIVMTRILAAICDGLIPEILTKLSGEKVVGLLANRDTRLSTVIFLAIWGGFGPSMLIYVGAMSGIDESISEAAQLDGATFIQESWYITLPLIYPTLVVQIIASISGIFMNQFGLYSFFRDTADVDIRTVGYWFYTQLQYANGDISQYPYLSSIGLLCTLATIPVAFGVRFVMNKLGPKTE